MLRDTLEQLRLAARFLRRTPAFTVPAVASLALGIAVNTTIFSVVNATLLRPIGTPTSADLVRIGRTERGMNEFRSIAYDEFIFLREHASSFTDMAGHQLDAVILRQPGSTQIVTGEIVAGNYFDLLAVRLPLGRGFAAEESGGFAAEPVAVISERFWRSRFAADRNVIGRSITLNDHPFTIVGVAPAGFHGTFPGVAVNVWLPAVRVDAARPGTHERTLMLLGRLKPGVSADAARAELDVLARRLSVQDPRHDRNRSFTVGSARGVHPLFARVLRLFLSLLMGVVGVVLLIACANVASLLLARANARRTELAVRLALGASRGQLVRQLLAESLVLAGLGGTLGLLLAILPMHLLNSLSITAGPMGDGLFLDVRPDRRVLLFTAAATMLTAFLFGLAPALHATRVSVLAALQGARAYGRVRARLLNALVVVQVSLAFVLLVAAALLFGSVRNAARMDVGFDPDRVFVASFDPHMLGYDRSQVAAFYDELLERARTLPGVEQAALADFVPLGDRGGHPQRLAIAGEVLAGERPTVSVGRVSDEYFTMLRQPLIRGRAFTAHDRGGAVRGVIVNEAFARRFWPGSDAMGKRIGLGEALTEHEVVGVARDARWGSYGSAVEPFVFVPAADERQLHLHVRTTALPAQTLMDIRRLAQDVDARVPVVAARTMREAMAFSLIPARIGRTVSGVAGIIALLLAAGGLYGIVCHALEQRLKEIGIRVALGASRRGVFQVIVGSALRLAVIGVLLGGAAAAAVTRLMTALLHGLSPTDPLSFAAVAALLIGATLAAACTAARRGLDVDPIVVLRHD